jgi:hypothetical protein
LVKVLVFRSTHKDVIAQDSQVAQLFKEIEAATQKISDQATVQLSGKNDIRISSAERTQARENLRKALDRLCRTAASIGLKQFFMPADKSDRALVAVGRIFVAAAEPLVAEFVANHLPVDFIERLKAAIEAIERSIEQQATSKDARKVATATIAEAQSAALAALIRLDPIMSNLLADNEPVRAAWVAARTIERASSSKKPTVSTSPPNPPIATAATNAA